MNRLAEIACKVSLCAALACFSALTWAQGVSNSIENLQVSQQGGNTIVKLQLKQPLAAPPGSFSIANPARLAFDFPATENGLGRNSQVINQGELRSLNVVQVGDRTRLVLNLRNMVPFETRVDGEALYITFAAQAAASTAATTLPAANFAQPAARDMQTLRDINFRRGKDGEARIAVDLSDPNVGIDIRQQGSNLVVDFMKTTLPENLRRRLDVTDFATPVTAISTLPQGDNVRMVITPGPGLWEHNAYQSDNQFVIEVKRVIENPNKLVQGSRGGYQGDKLSLNFQNVEVRAVLQVIADFTNFNIITSDTVGGNVTLRLKDVPWDQALDIILQAKGLDMRKNGNVIWIAPRDELAAREKAQLESRAQLGDLEPTHTESFQLNYQKAIDVQKLLADKLQPVLSKRGTVVVDAQTNKLFVNDSAARLEEVRRLIAEIDQPVRQVLIEARIVEATSNFSSSLGVRLGVHNVSPNGSPLTSGTRYTIGGGLADTGFHTGQVATTPDFFNNSLGVNLPAAPAVGQAGQFSLVLFNNAMSKFLNLELSALEADSKGKIISSPRVVTANHKEAIIEQGTELPYQQATNSGATAVTFRKANLTLKVTPQITPDGRLILALEVNKDSANQSIPSSFGIPIDTKHVKTEVLIENGGTVVIGGIYTQNESNAVTRIPFFGDLPIVGALFREKQVSDAKTELLVFITPRIVSDALSLR